ncbi:MAG: nucleoside 2-deoxyribosyltransferase [Alphaproteobacteria bacterium]|nr:nucleoside 2-deoxyribosyltransferase [Alphaproteobacteria bacterium]
MRVYLAGPDVFLPDAAARAVRLKAICAAHGLIGISPLDTLEDVPAAWRALPEARFIALCNEAHITRCDAMIANLTPFRGPSADVGTVFEIGYMRALRRPIFGWTNDAADFLTRSTAFVGSDVAEFGGERRDGEGMLLEAFGMHDNLMIDGAILSSGGAIFTATPAIGARWSDLSAFTSCAAALGGRKRNG